MYSQTELINELFGGEKLQNEFIQGFQNVKNANAIQAKSMVGITSLFSVNKEKLSDENDTVFK